MGSATLSNKVMQRTAPEDDWYQAKIVGFEEVKSAPEYGEKEQYKVTFEVISPDDEDANGYRISKWISRFFDADGNEIIPMLSEKAIIVEFVGAVYPNLKADDDDEADFSLEALGGKLVRINIVTKKNAKGAMTTKVDGIRPPSAKAKKAAA